MAIDNILEGTDCSGKIWGISTSFVRSASVIFNITVLCELFVRTAVQMRCLESFAGCKTDDITGVASKGSALRKGLEGNLCQVKPDMRDCKAKICSAKF